MSEFFIIAGPQAAGKSTVIYHLNRQCRNASLLFPQRHPLLLFPLQESRQIIAHKYMHLGAIFMTLRDEREVVRCDLARMDIILKRTRDRLLYLDECNLFTIAHAAAHGIKDIERYFDRYMLRLEKLNVKIIFLDVPPDLSWERRRPVYEQRLVYFAKHRRKKIMEQYQMYQERTYPLLRALYDRVPCPKTIIDARMSEWLLTEEVSRTLMHLSCKPEQLHEMRVRGLIA